MDEELEKLKSLLKSIVGSSIDKVDLKILMKTYYDLYGSTMPYYEFGYKTPLSFIKKCCSDIFQFAGQPCNPVLILNVPDHPKNNNKGMRPFTTRRKKVGRKKKLVVRLETKTDLVSSGYAKYRPGCTQKASEDHLRPPFKTVSVPSTLSVRNTVSVATQTQDKPQPY